MGLYKTERISDIKVLNAVHITFDESIFPGLGKGDSSSNGEESLEYNMANKGSSIDI